MTIAPRTTSLAATLGMGRPMRVLSLLLAAALLSAAHAAPKGQPSIQVVRTAAAVLVIYTVRLTGNPDTTRVTFTGSAGGSGTMTVKLTGNANLIDTVSYPVPGEGTKISGSVTATPWRGTQPFTPGVAAWEYTGPLIPKAVVDVQAKQISLQVAPGASVQVCGLARLEDGTRSRAVPWPVACEPWFATAS